MYYYTITITIGNHIKFLYYFSLFLIKLSIKKTYFMKNTNRYLLILLSTLLQLNAAIGQTTITDNIYSSTTWTASGSPYTIANNIVLFAGAALTIEPGVTVLFNDGVTFDFRGQLIANGTATNRIFFTSSNPTPSAGKYVGLKVTGYINTSSSITNQITMSYCNVSYAVNFLDLSISCQGPFNIHHCCFYNNISGIGNSPNCGNMYVDSCKFEGNETGVAQNHNGPVYVSKCLFVNNSMGTTANFVSNSVFTGNKVGVFAYTSLTNCEIYGNELGADCDVHGGSTVNNNNIHDNVTGVRINRIAGGTFRQNKICHNSTWNIQYTGVFNSDASYNCFCSTDSAYIRSKLKDGYVDASLGLLAYNVFSSCSSGITETRAIEKAENSVKIYPNPFSNSTTLEFNYSPGDVYKLIISDQLGRTISVMDNILAGDVVISKKNMTPGIYYYRLWNGQQIWNTGKLVVE